MTNRDRLLNELKKAKTNCLIKEGGGCLACTYRGQADCTLENIADYLLANGVIPLPCKFQQEVYVLPTINNNLPEITKMKCIGFILSCDMYNANLVNDKNKLYQPCFGDFGKTVFITKEEAEEKLKERDNNGRENYY
jgi:hypothetical protein